MTDYADNTRTPMLQSQKAPADNGDQAAATEVLKSITSVLVPLTVFMLPNSEKLIPAIDTVVDRNFDIVTKFVECSTSLGSLLSISWVLRAHLQLIPAGAPARRCALLTTPLS